MQHSADSGCCAWRRCSHHTLAATSETLGYAFHQTAGKLAASLLIALLTCLLFVACSGALDRWYQSEPANEKRHFVEMIRLRGRAPTRLELQCALTRVAAEHPRLLMLPHPDEWRIHSQLPVLAAAAGASSPSDTLPFPLPLLSDWVAEPVEWAGAPGSEAATAQLRQLFEHALTDPVANDPPKEQCAAGYKGPTYFRTVHLQLVHWGDKKQQQHAAAANDEQQEEFALILHVTHNLGDGVAGLLLFRHLFAFIHSAREASKSSSAVSSALLSTGAAAAVTTPKRIPLSAFRPLSEYPSMDDVLDLRPSGWRMWTLWLQAPQRLPQWKKKVGIKPTQPWFDGEGGMGLRLKPGEWGHRTTFLHLSPEQLEALSNAARKQGATVQAALHVATAFAAGVASGEKGVVHLLTGTSVNLRRFCSASGSSEQVKHLAASTRYTAATTPPPPEHLIENCVAITMDNLLLDASASASSSGGILGFLGLGGKGSSNHAAQEAWSVGRAYLSRLHGAFPFVIGTVGLLTMFNARYIVRGKAMPLRNQRSASVVISNLGVVGGPAEESFVNQSASAAPSGDKEQQKVQAPLPASLLSLWGYSLEDAWFGQTAQHVHGLFVNSVISTPKGGCNLLLTTPTGPVLSEKALQTYVRTFYYVIHRLAQGNQVEYAQLANLIRNSEAQSSTANTQAESSITRPPAAAAAAAAAPTATAAATA